MVGFALNLKFPINSSEDTNHKLLDVKTNSDNADHPAAERDPPSKCPMSFPIFLMILFDNEMEFI